MTVRHYYAWTTIQADCGAFAGGELPFYYQGIPFPHVLGRGIRRLPQLLMPST
jgi:hypothetical protein